MPRNFAHTRMFHRFLSTIFIMQFYFLSFLICFILILTIIPFALLELQAFECENETTRLHAKVSQLVQARWRKLSVKEFHLTVTTEQTNSLSNLMKFITMQYQTQYLLQVACCLLFCWVVVLTIFCKCFFYRFTTFKL